MATDEEEAQELPALMGEVGRLLAEASGLVAKVQEILTRDERADTDEGDPSGR